MAIIKSTVGIGSLRIVILQTEVSHFSKVSFPSNFKENDPKIFHTDFVLLVNEVFIAGFVSPWLGGGEKSRGVPLLE